MTIVEITIANDYRKAIVDEVDKDFRSTTLYRGGNHGTSLSYRVNSKNVKLSRTILERKLNRKLNPNEFCDFVNKNSFDCRRVNLRVASLTELRRHTRKTITNSSGYKGVSRDKRKQQWRADISINNRDVWLGNYDHPEHAYAAYCRAAEKHYGEFACLE